MLDLFKTVAPHGSTIMAGHNESYAAFLAVQLMGDALRHGFDVVEIVDTLDESARERIAARVAEFNLDAAMLDHLHTIEKGWTFADPHVLAAAIKLAITGDRPVIAVRIVPALQISQWLPLAKAAVAHMDDTSAILTAANWGSTLTPTPRLADWPADRLWHIRTSHHQQVSLTDIATGEALKFHGEVYGTAKIMLFREVEVHHV